MGFGTMVVVIYKPISGLVCINELKKHGKWFTQWEFPTFPRFIYFINTCHFVPSRPKKSYHGAKVQKWLIIMRS